jgi:predicted phage tail protein
VTELLCKKGKKNIAIKNPLKFKINTLGTQAINGNLHITISNSSKTHEIGKYFIETRLANTESKELIDILENSLKNSKLTKNEIKSIMKENNTSLEKFIKKINKNLENKDLSTDEIAKKLKNNVKKKA